MALPICMGILHFPPRAERFICMRWLGRLVMAAAPSQDPSRSWLRTSLAQPLQTAQR